jgi:hypothetical protein
MSMTGVDQRTAALVVPPKAERVRGRDVAQAVREPSYGQTYPGRESAPSTDHRGPNLPTPVAASAAQRWASPASKYAGSLAQRALDPSRQQGVR